MECDRAANFDAPLVADGLLFESCYRSPGHQLLYSLGAITLDASLDKPEKQLDLLDA